MVWKVNTGNGAYAILFRYLFLLVLGLGELFIIYEISAPLTIYPTYYLLKIFYTIQLSGISLIVGSRTIQIVEACVAPAAYYLLLILNLSTPMNASKRFYSIFFSLILLLALNIIRIVTLSILFISNSAAFDVSHKLLWYGLSTIFVVGIWFLTVYIYKIKEIPFYTDFIIFKKLIKR